MSCKNLRSKNYFGVGILKKKALKESFIPFGLIEQNIRKTDEVNTELWRQSYMKYPSTSSFSSHASPKAIRNDIKSLHEL